MKDGCGDDDICSLGPVELEPETSDRQQYCAGEADRLAERACRHLDLATGEVSDHVLLIIHIQPCVTL